MFRFRRALARLVCVGLRFRMSRRSRRARRAFTGGPPSGRPLPGRGVSDAPIEAEWGRLFKLPSSNPFPEEWVFEKVFAVEFVDNLIGDEAFEGFGYAAYITNPVGHHELAGKNF